MDRRDPKMLTDADVAALSPYERKCYRLAMNGLPNPEFLTVGPIETAPKPATEPEPEDAQEE